MNGTTMLDPYATGFTAETHPYNIPFGWQFGALFNQKRVNSYASDIAEQFAAYNKGARTVPHLGCTVDLTNISTEQTSLANVVQQYLDPLTKGTSDPATGVPEFRKALKVNGVGKFIAEIQSPIDAFTAK